MTKEERSLTDRECTGILGGTIGTLLQVASPARVERAIRWLARKEAERLGKDTEPLAALNPIELDSRPRRVMTDDECVCVLRGTIDSLLQLTSSTEVERAIQWWVEHPESLMHILSLTRSTLNRTNPTD
jgi:hypothetical protein